MEGPYRASEGLPDAEPEEAIVSGLTYQLTGKCQGCGYLAPTWMSDGYALTGKGRRQADCPICNERTTWDRAPEVRAAGALILGNLR